MNKISIKLTQQVNQELVIPISLKWDYLGIDSNIQEYETSIINEIIGRGNDFEVSRFSHFGNGTDTEINYEFYFFSGGSLSNITNWTIDYRNQGFSTEDIYYYSNSFTKSFFKLDLYDSPDDKKQTNYITIILPTQQGIKMPVNMQRTPVNIKQPKFKLNFLGDKEGFFIYWLKDEEYLNISTFYMSAKFYNAKTGQFVKMMVGSNSDNDNTNGPQSKLGDKFSFDSTKFFYYKVDLNYGNMTYSVSNQNGQILGQSVPIKWFEYVNP